MQRPTLNTAKSLIFHDDHSAAPNSTGPTAEPNASGTRTPGAPKTPGFQTTIKPDGTTGSVVAEETNPFDAPFDVIPNAPPPSVDQSRQPPAGPAQQALQSQAAPVGGLQSDTAEGREAGHLIPAVNSDAREYYGTEVHSRARTYSTVRSPRLHSSGRGRCGRSLFASTSLSPVPPGRYSELTPLLCARFRSPLRSLLGRPLARRRWHRRGHHEPSAPAVARFVSLSPFSPSLLPGLWRRVKRAGGKIALLLSRSQESRGGRGEGPRGSAMPQLQVSIPLARPLARSL